VDHRCGLAPDRVLLGPLDPLANVERAFRTAPQGHGAAVRPDEPSLRLERREVLPDRHAGHVEPRRQVGHPGATMLLDDAGDVFLALFGEDVARGRVARHGHPWVRWMSPLRFGP